LLAICKNSHAANIEVDLSKNVQTLMQVLNRSENKFNGIIKNKVVLLLEALIKGKSLPLN